MSLTFGERVGAALGFIPVVSTVVGGIEAYNYYKREKAHLSCQNALAQKVRDAGLQNIYQNQARCEDKLFKISLVEMIPIVNIIAAFFKVRELAKLSKVSDKMSKMIEFTDWTRKPITHIALQVNALKDKGKDSRNYAIDKTKTFGDLKNNLCALNNIHDFENYNLMYRGKRLPENDRIDAHFSNPNTLYKVTFIRKPNLK